jgi:DNA methylase
MRDRLSILEAIHCEAPVTGYTHDFYKYPARFSPNFARGIIQNFSKPGDVVLDPFMGSGTTIVEANAQARHAVGTDISSLAVFVAQAKTAHLLPSDVTSLRDWAKALPDGLNLRNTVEQSAEHPPEYYQRNINSKMVWPIKKTIELLLSRISLLPEGRQRAFARCVVLRTAQWALDCRKNVPSVGEMREQFFRRAEQMLNGSEELHAATRDAKKKYKIGKVVSRCLNRSAIGMENDGPLQSFGAPALVLTSPPYPGMHVLYHRWQILGRKETPAPFWIAGTHDGHGASFYTMGDRQEDELKTYYTQMLEAFRSVVRICSSRTVIVQMLAFSEPKWQMSLYLSTMKRAGLVEVKHAELSNTRDGRIWRSVPNRKWYANQRGPTGGSSEVVLFFRREQ